MSVSRPLLLCLTLTVALAMLSSPLLAASLVMPVAGEVAYGVPHDVAISGDYAYVAAQGALSVFDISNPARPVMVAIVDTPGSAEGVAVSGSYVYVADWDTGLRVVNITDPTAPVEVGHYDTPGYAYGVAVSGSYAYVADHAAGLRIVNVSTPASPTSAGSYDTPGYAWGVAVSGNYAYVADGFAGMVVLNVTNPAAVTEVDTFDALDKVMDVAVSADGDYVFYTDGTAIGVVDITTPASPVSLGTKLGAELSGSGMGLFVDGNTLFLAAGTGGLYAIDVTDPSAPSVLESLDTPGNAYAVAASGTAAVVADDAGGVRVVDVSTVPAPTVVSQAQTSGNAEAVAVDGDYAYVGDADGGLVAFDVSNPRAPDELWACTEGGLKAMDVSVRGDYAYVANWSGELRIVDVADPSGPVCTYGSCATSGHPTGLYLAEAGGRAYLAAGDVGVVIVDASDPAAPAVLDTVDTTGTANDVVVDGNYAYVADGASGLAILDAFAATGVVGTASTAGYAWGVDYADGYAYLASGDVGLEVYDVSTPASPVRVATLGPAQGLAGSAHSVVIGGQFAYVSAGGRGVTVVDIRDPLDPAVVSTCGTPSVPGPSDLTVAGGYAYVADAEAGLVIVDVMQPYSELAKCESPAYGEKLAVVGQTDGTGVAYIASGTAGLQMVQVTDSEEPDDPALVRTNRTLGDVTDVAVQGTYGYVTDASGQLTVMNLSNSTSPLTVGQVDTPGSALGVGATTIGAANYALVADGYEGVSVVSTVNPNKPARRAALDTPGWCSEAVGATLAGDPFAVVADGQSGLRLISISAAGTTQLATIFSDDFEAGLAAEWNPSNAEWYNSSPRRGLYSVRLSGGGSIERTISTELHTGITVSFYLGASELEAGEYVMAKWSPDGGTTWTSLKEIAHVEDPDAPTEEDGRLRLYSFALPSDADDATDFRLRFELSGDAADDYGFVDDVVMKGSTSEQPFEVGFYNTPGQARGVALAGSYACVADGTAGLRVIDVTTPGAPTQTGYLDTSGYAEAVTLATYDRVVAVADGSNGLVLVDISKPTAPAEVAHYDTPGWASDVKVLDDHAYVIDSGWGLTVLQLWYSFRDVLFGHWAFFQIEAAVEHEITVGYQDGKYHPEYSCTRDQMCVFIARAQGWVTIGEPMNTAPALYDDVPEGFWAGLAIQECGDHEVVKGYTDKYFRPTAPVKRDDMAVFMARVRGWVGINDPMDTEDQLFTDVPASYWCGKAIKVCIDNGVVKGYGDGTYRPSVPVTRDQMAVYIYRTFGLSSP